MKNIQNNCKTSESEKDHKEEFVIPYNQTSKEENFSMSAVYLDFYKFFDRLSAYGAFIRLKPQCFSTFNAHTLKPKANSRKNDLLV